MAMHDSEPIDPEDGPPPAPRWVKIAVGVAALLAVLVVVLLIAGGNHGPGRHSATAGIADSSVVAA